MKCRFCNTETRMFLSLGSTPLANSFLKKEQLNQMESTYPLDLNVCQECFLVQVDEFEAPADIFSDYAYFSGYSISWLKHCKEYVDKIVERCPTLGQVVEIGSNDGYLLQYFKEKGIYVLGVEPAENIAEIARKKGIPTVTKFFGIKTANKLKEEGFKADLFIGNNVLAHVPDLNDFVAGLKILLKPDGIITMEFPHLMKLIENVQFDTIYHEHFSYFSFMTVEKVFAAHELTIHHVEELPTHGGSLRIWACHEGNNFPSTSVHLLREIERQAGYNSIDRYVSFAQMTAKRKRVILADLIRIKNAGKSIVGYGAAAKGNTLLNYCGIGADFLDYIVDKNPHKQGLYTPGSRIPIEPVEKLREIKPDYVFILPWNISKEIKKQVSFIEEWGGKFVN